MENWSSKVGQIVHYMALGSKDGAYPAAERAAIITEIISWGGSPDLWKVKLAVFNPQGFHWTEASFSEERKPGTWCWLPKGLTMKDFRHLPTIAKASQWRTGRDHPGLQFSLDLKHAFIGNDRGRVLVKDGDWIVTGLDGEVYPVTDQVFKQLYEELVG